MWQVMSDPHYFTVTWVIVGMSGANTFAADGPINYVGTKILTDLQTENPGQGLSPAWGNAMFGAI